LSLRTRRKAPQPGQGGLSALAKAGQNPIDQTIQAVGRLGMAYVCPAGDGPGDFRLSHPVPAYQAHRSRLRGWHPKFLNLKAEYSKIRSEADMNRF
jgi:hypothetical protein